MRYFIDRSTTNDMEDGEPLEGAEMVEVEVRDVRTCATPEEFDVKQKHEKPWLSEGTDHQQIVVDGRPHISRRIAGRKVKMWTIEVADLNAFVEKYGQIVLMPSRPWRFVGEAYQSIEIYDGYRE